MLESMLANLGILLLMHLCINTAYNFHQLEKISGKILPVLHVFIVSLTIIAMFYFPLSYQGQNFDLRIVPLIFIALYHGPWYTIPVLAITSGYRFVMLAAHPAWELLSSLLLPVIIPIVLYPRYKEKSKNIIFFPVIAAGWLITDLTGIFLFNHSVELALIHFIFIMIASLILYFFIHTGIKLLEATNKLLFYAERDPLTGLYNMRTFEEKVLHYIPDRTKMFIAMIDIDRFKRINDYFGHRIGDYAIKGVADILSEMKSVYIGRYGGDEFILFIPADSLDEVMQKLNSLCRNVTEAPILEKGGVLSFPISLSIGVAELENPGQLIQTIETADRQLYLAKQSGRNRVC